MSKLVGSFTLLEVVMNKKTILLVLILFIPIILFIFISLNNEVKNNDEELSTKDETIYKVNQPIENEIMKIVVYSSELSKKWRGKEEIKEYLEMNLPEIPVEKDGTLGEGYTYLYTQIEATNKTEKNNPREFTEFQTGMEVFTEPKIDPNDTNRLSVTYGPIGKDLFNPHVNFVTLDYREIKKVNLFSIVKEDTINKGEKYYGAIDLRSDMTEKEDLPRFVELEIKEEANE